MYDAQYLLRDFCPCRVKDGVKITAEAYTAFFERVSTILVQKEKLVI